MNKCLENKVLDFFPHIYIYIFIQQAPLTNFKLAFLILAVQGPPASTIIK